MGRNSKWIESQPSDDVAAVAERACRGRLHRMWHFLERAADLKFGQQESVHQLRVFARCAGAALDLFEDWLPAKRGRWMQKQVKCTRQAAGEARDCDVLLARIAAHKETIPAEEKSLLVKELQARRKEAQGPINKAWEKLSRRRFNHKVSRLVDKIRPPDDNAAANFGAMAQQSLSRWVRSYLAAGRQEMDAEALHAFRIEGKHVRYAMEIFAGTFDDEFRQQLYPVVAHLQDRLGAINDHVTAEKHFTAWVAGTKDAATRQALAAAIKREQTGLERKRIDFLNWWSCERREELRLRFSRYVDLIEPVAVEADGA